MTRPVFGSALLLELGLLMLTPMLIGGVAMLLLQLERMRRELEHSPDPVRRAQLLSRSIVGNDRAAIASVLGPPQASAGVRSGTAFLAGTWYYRLSGPHRIALAIQFERDVAADVLVMQL
jgi:hypothetical protein